MNYKEQVEQAKRTAIQWRKDNPVVGCGDLRVDLMALDLSDSIMELLDRVEKLEAQRDESRRDCAVAEENYRLEKRRRKEANDRAEKVEKQLKALSMFALGRPVMMTGQREVISFCGIPVDEAMDWILDYPKLKRKLEKSNKLVQEIEKALGDDFSLDRLRELAEADRDGRCVVLPCKDWLEIVFGEQEIFYGIDHDYEENPVREITVCNEDRFTWYDGWETVVLKGSDENGLDWEFSPEDVGKTVFFTREAAEAAIKGEQNGNVV